MSAVRQIRNIALVGFMGAGKTTVGGIVAHLLHFEFIDTDRIIETRENQRISDLFAKEGEAGFRAKESALCREFEGTCQKVISTGGGMIINPANLESLRRHALVVTLWASPETIYARLKHQTHRPLLQTPDPLATIRELMRQRGPAYKQADVLVGVDFRSPADTARHIAQSFRRVIGADPASRPAPAAPVAPVALASCPAAG